METSAALGFGFRCGFLGLLHLEIIQERLERESSDLDLIATAPTVSLPGDPAGSGEVIELHNPADMPDPSRIESRSPSPGSRPPSSPADEYLGAVIKLCQDRRGEYRRPSSPTSARRALVVYVPAAERGRSSTSTTA